MTGTDSGPHLLAAAWPALTVSAIVPAALLAARRAGLPLRPPLPAAAALPLFLAAHATATVYQAAARPEALVDVMLTAAVVSGAVVFWLPVLGRGHHRALDGAGRCLYLYLAGPGLDLPAAAMITLGDTTGGLAMVAAMLPVPGAALVTTWRWITEEERLANAAGAAGAVSR